MIRKLTAICLAISVVFSGLIVDGMAATKKKKSRGHHSRSFVTQKLKGYCGSTPSRFSKLRD